MEIKDHDSEFLQLILDTIPDPVFVKNIKHQWIYGNRSFSNLLEQEPKNYLGKTDHDLFHADNADHYWRIDDQVFESQKPVEIEEAFQLRQNGERTLLTHKIPCQNAQKEKILVGVIKDITETKMAQLAAQEVARLASLGEMAAGIAHEINNPLEIIKGTASLVRRRLNKGTPVTVEDLHHSLKTIEDTSLRIASIIKGLNLFSRRQGMESKVSKKISEIIEDTLMIAREKFKINGVVFTCNLQDDPAIECHPVQISQVLLNLLNNSCDAIKNLSQRWINLSCQLQVEQVCIKITDSGTGIPVEIANRIMEPFFTTKAVNEGSGLGLSISKGIIESHKGKMLLNSQHEHTQFLVYLPLVDTP